MISPLFDSNAWNEITDFEFQDITLHKAKETGAVRIAFNRPDILNAFRPLTVDELLTAFEWAHRQNDVGCILLTGNGPSTKHEGKNGWSFSAGGDQNVRGKSGYEYKDTAKPGMPLAHGRLHILEVQRMIRFMPKIVIAVVPGWAVGGGHSLHVVCDMTIASKEHAVFRQTDPDVATIQGLQCLLGNVFIVIISLIGLAAFVMFVIAAFRYMTSGGNTKGTETARNTMTFAVIGIVVALSGFIVLNLLSSFTGLDEVTNISLPSSDDGL